MSSASIVVKGIVIKKTKLGESDLIVSLLAEDGSLFQGVAKGARKPSNSFSSRLELFSLVQVFGAAGKSLAIIQDVRLMDAHVSLRNNFECSAGASVTAELLTKLCQNGLSVNRLYDLVQSSFRHMESADTLHSVALVLAALLKIMALCGIRPSFVNCVGCGADLDSELYREKPCSFSYTDGGFLCADCAGMSSEMTYAAVDLLWLETLLMSTFDDIVVREIPVEVIGFGFQFIQMWSRVHLGITLKSIPFLLTTAQIET